MGGLAFVFAGQGTQYTGMGKDFYENSPSSRNVFDILDRIRPGTSSQCFTASKEELSVTENTQPCVFAAEMAAVAALEEKNIRPDAVAGFSLGEISALTYSGLFSLEEWFEFIMKRGAAMNRAAESENGRMAAILRLDADVIRKICATRKKVWPVNYNCPGQTVISGIESSVSEVVEECRKLGGKGIFLSVNGAFHTPLMAEASDTIDTLLENKTFQTPRFPIYSNVTGEIMETGLLRQRIAEQVKSPVLWSKTIDSMRRDGITMFIEIGPGKVLSGLIRKNFPDAVIANVEDMPSLGNAVEMADRYRR